MNCKSEELVFSGMLNENSAYPYICESCGEMGEMPQSEAPAHASTITLKYKRLVKKFKSHETETSQSPQERKVLELDLDEELKALLA